MSWTPVILGVLVGLILVVIEHFLGKDDKTNSENQTDSQVFTRYSCDNSELAHAFAMRATRLQGFLSILHAIVIFAFLFFPLDGASVDNLLESLLEFVSDPEGSLTEPFCILALSFCVWGIFHFICGIITFIRRLRRDFTFDAGDYSTFFESCADSFISRALGNLIVPVFAGAFWFFCLYMLDISFEDVMIPFIALCAYLIVSEALGLSLRHSVYTKREEYEISENTYPLEMLSSVDSEYKSRGNFFTKNIGFFLVLAFIVYLVLFKFVF